jgi:hypothetical protein
MPRPVRDGAFYEFNRPIGYYEVGVEIHESIAQMDVRFGRDVYTPRAADAKAMAKKISSFQPKWHRRTKPCIFHTTIPAVRVLDMSSTELAARISNGNLPSVMRPPAFPLPPANRASVFPAKC